MGTPDTALRMGQRWGGLVAQGAGSGVKFLPYSYSVPQFPHPESEEIEGGYKQRPGGLGHPRASLPEAPLPVSSLGSAPTSGPVTLGPPWGPCSC